ncbi:MAG: hypothetical protein K6A68_14500 [Clostridiales bacterium]|nr:hypothetical protein [Clostridiales bacterium]
MEYAIRIFIFCICIMAVIPLGCLCGQQIEAANAESIETAINDAETANEIVESIPDDAKNKNTFDKVGDFFSNLWNSASDVYDWVKGVLSNFVKAMAVMLVTTIVIPVLIFIACLCLIKFLTGRDFVRSAIDFKGKVQTSSAPILQESGENHK